MQDPGRVGPWLQGTLCHLYQGQRAGVGGGEHRAQPYLLVKVPRTWEVMYHYGQKLVDGCKNSAMWVGWVCVWRVWNVGVFWDLLGKEK